MIAQCPNCGGFTPATTVRREHGETFICCPRCGRVPFSAYRGPNNRPTKPPR